MSAAPLQLKRAWPCGTVLPSGHGLLHLPEASSTNTLALAIAAGRPDAPELSRFDLGSDTSDPPLTHLWVWAERQTAGRGRAGRPWRDETGGLSVTLLMFCDTCPLADLTLLPFATGIAVWETLASVAPGLADRPRTDTQTRFVLKWPNDVFVGRNKLAGMLIETTVPAPAHRVGPRTGQTFGAAAAIGIGVNLTRAPDLTDRGTTALSDHGPSLTPAELLPELCRHAARWLSPFAGSPSPSTVAAHKRDVQVQWGARALPPETPVLLGDPADDNRAHILGLDADGALRVRLRGGATKRVTYGDVSVHL